MPSISYNGQSFSIDGKRIWILGASIQYARVPARLWAPRIAAAKQAGFNTIVTACPWSVHEPRSGRYVFDGDQDVRKFIQTCAAAGMRVVVRVGPYVGQQFDGGGLPGWLIETPGVRLRENNPVFLEHVSRYFRRLISEIADFQVTTGGPILLVQSENAWTSTNESQAETYLHDVTRIIRESGITVPVINANDLWQDSRDTIDTWRGYDDLLAHLRQLRTVQPEAPRLVSEFHAADFAIWGEPDKGKLSRGDGKTGTAMRAEKTAAAVTRRLAEVLAAGAQPLVTPFHAGTNFDFLAGRLPGSQNGFLTTSAAVDPPLGEAGMRGRKYHAIRRLITFANHFGHIFSELDPEYQPIVLDPETTSISSGQRGGKAAKGPVSGRALASVVPLRGAYGRIVFVFAGSDDIDQRSDARLDTATLVLDDGIRLPVHLGDQSVGWFALDVDLQGLGRLDFSNICPWGMVDRSIVVFQGPAGASAYISISGTPLEVNVPQGLTNPVVIEHRGLTIVVCNQEQIDATYHDDAAVYVGIEGFDAAGSPVKSPQFARAYVVRTNARLTELQEKSNGPAEGKRRAANRPVSRAQVQNIALSPWQVSGTAAYVSGQSPRFASLEGPRSLSECGAPTGYGWYRATVNVAGKKFCHLPHAADRLHLFVGGERAHLFGVGPGARPDPFELRLSGGESPLVVLADNFGRFSEGNDLAQPKGIWGGLHEVKALRGVKPKAQTAKPVDPFVLRGFISGRGAGQLSDTEQVVWTIAHTRKTPILIDVNGARTSGTFVLNDEPIAYYAGATGGCLDRILIDPATNESFKRGKNILRFAPDAKQPKAIEDITKCTHLFECVRTLTEPDSWAFAKWEPPATSTYDLPDKSSGRASRGLPCWWRTTFALEEEDASMGGAPFWLEMEGMSKGQAYVNGENIGRFFTATANNKPVGPQFTLYVPEPWLRFGQTNELVVFDEHGFDPAQVRLFRGNR